jgi:hypothetical protein
MEYWRDHRHTTRTEDGIVKTATATSTQTNHGGTRAAKILPEDKIIMIDENHQIGMDDEEMDLGGDGANDAE